MLTGVTHTQLPTILADKYGNANTLIPCTLAASILAFAWIAVSTPAGMVVWVIIYGFFAGSFISLTVPLLVSLCPNMALFGTRTGMLSIPMGLGLLIGNPIGAAIIGRGWTSVQVFTGVVILVTALFVVGVRVTKAGWVLVKF